LSRMLDRAPRSCAPRHPTDEFLDSPSVGLVSD
jgi:hypothetical protein